MTNFKRIFVGFFLTFLTAWIGLVVVPVRHFAREKKETAPTIAKNEALVREGARVYSANGCIYCHSQQVRPSPFSDDIERGWGDRRTTPRNYLDDQRIFLGTSRTGPDLSNIGARQSSTSWHYQHLYDPRSVSPGSIMPAARSSTAIRKSFRIATRTLSWLILLRFVVQRHLQPRLKTKPIHE